MNQCLAVYAHFIFLFLGALSAKEPSRGKHVKDEFKDSANEHCNG